MQDFTTGWFDTKQTNLQAKCNVRVTRNFKEVRIDWSVLMSLKTATASIPKSTYIDVMVNGSKNTSLLGDVDGDGKVTQADAELILEFGVGKKTPTAAQFLLADVNSDGAITARDSKLVLQYATDPTTSDIIGRQVSPINMGSGHDRIKGTDVSWNGTAEHSISGVLTFETENAGTGLLTFSSTGNFASPAVFDNKVLKVSYPAYDKDAESESSMPFHSVFTTEEYLQNHKGLVPRNNLCNN